MRPVLCNDCLWELFCLLSWTVSCLQRGPDHPYLLYPTYSLLEGRAYGKRLITAWWKEGRKGRRDRGREAGRRAEGGKKERFVFIIFGPHISESVPWRGSPMTILVPIWEVPWRGEQLRALASIPGFRFQLAFLAKQPWASCFSESQFPLYRKRGIASSSLI